MKKTAFVVLTIVITLLNSMAQTSPASLQWERSQNGVASRSNYYIKAKNDLNGNTYALSASDDDILVVKFNSSTQVSQTYLYNNSTNTPDYGTDFEVDINGNVYISGSSFVGSLYRSTIVKFAPNGSKLWELNYLPGNVWVYPTEVSANAICLDNAGNVYFTGASNDSLIVGKVNTNGVVQWATKVSVNGIYSGSGSDIAIDAFNSVYVAGKTKNASGDFDAVALKVNGSGVLQWTKVIAGSAGADDASVNIGVDNSSNAYVSSNIADTSASNLTPYLTKYNASGAQQWQKKLRQSPQINSIAVKLLVDNVGNSFFGIHTITSSGYGYAKLYKHNASGTQSYATVVDDVIENDNSLTDIFVDQNSNAYLTGNLTGTGKLFFTKLNSAGAIVLNPQFNHGGASNLNYYAGIVAEQSGFLNLVTSGGQLFNCRFNNAGVFLYEGVYAGSANTYDKAVKTIAQGGASVYALGQVTNDNTYVDAVLSKYDNQGNILWQNIIDNNSGNDDAYDMGKDSVFNIYVVKAISSGSELVKYDSIGSPIWTAPNSVMFKKCIIANGGHAYLAGDGESSSNSFASLRAGKVGPTGTPLYVSSASPQAGYQTFLGSMNVDNSDQIIAAGHRWYNYGQPDQKLAIIVDKFSNLGALVWQKQVPLIDSISGAALLYSYVSKVLVDASNDVFVFGTQTTSSGFGHSVAFLTKISAAGTIQWTQYYDGNGAWHEEGGDMRFLSNGQIVAYSGSPSYQIIKKINPSNGNVIWETTTYVGVSNEARSLRVDANDDIFFGGQAVIGNASRELVLGKINANGVIKWIATKGGAFAGNDYTANIDVTNNGRIYVAASMSNSSGAQSDFSLLKFCDIAQPSLTTIGQTQNICSGTSVTLISDVGTSYLWNDGVTQSDTLIANASGDYFCTVYKSDGCYKNTDTVNVLVKLPPSTPQICAVTVDSMSTHNIIVWDKTGVTGATAFNIYREDVTNVYSYIGTVLYDSLSEFHDYGANPNVTTKRYKISAMDTCGQESQLSNYHNTIYIVSNGFGQFSWNPIYTIENTANPVNNYLLMRDDLSDGNWAQVQSTAGNQNTIVDPAYASYPNARWRVETAWNITCVPTRGAINTSRSNIKSPTSIGINELVFNTSSFVMSPNPSNGQLSLQLSGRVQKATVSIYNTLGQKVLVQPIDSDKALLNIEILEAGTYFVEVATQQGSATKKLIKY